MRTAAEDVQFICTGIGGFIGYFLGGFDGFLYALFVFVVADYVTGVMAAIIHKELSSGVGFLGICRKVLIFCLVGIAHILDDQVIKTGSILRTAVIFFYLSNEGISFIENIDRIGLPVPKRLVDVLDQLRKKSEEEEEKGEKEDEDN